MRQTILAVVLEVRPESCARLAGLIRALRTRLEGPSAGIAKFALLRDGVPALHFLSMSIFRDEHYDPLFTLEANFDGPPGPFWAQLEAAVGDALREILRCCKSPADEVHGLYEAVTRPHSTRALAPYLEAKTVRPAVSHMGNRGLDRDRIIAEGELFKATRVELSQPAPDRPNPYRGLDAQGIHLRLRAALLRDHPWLAAKAPVRIGWGESLADYARLAGFLFLVIFGLSVPGLVLAPIGSTARVAMAIVVATLVAGGCLYRLRYPLRGQAAPGQPKGLLSTKRGVSSPGNPFTALALALGFIGACTLIAASIGTPLISALTGEGLGDSFRSTWRATLLGAASIPFSACVVLLWVRWLEYRDPSHDDPPIDKRRMRAMARREDKLAQNHMGSLVLVKPGLLRAVVVRVGLWGLGLLIRVFARSGYLANMRTIHFAHWALVGNGGRLLFFSNFDGTWESYLDDFIEKANEGLTLAWTNGVGFPPTRFLVQDGARHGRRFKDWARHSMAVTLLWYSAYRDFTVNQIERNARIADGLRRPTLTPKEATAWARDL